MEEIFISTGKERKIGVILSYVVIFLNIIISILYTPLLTGMLGQSEYGLYSMVYSIISYLTILDFGFGTAIIIFASKYRLNNEYEKEKNLYGMFFKLYLVIGLLAFIIGILFSSFSSSIFGLNMSVDELKILKELLIILSINIAISFPFSIYSAIINAHEKFITLKIINILNIILKPLMMIPILFLGGKSVALAIVVTLINFFTMSLNAFYCYFKMKIKFNYNFWDVTLLKKMMKYSFWIFLVVIVEKINWSLDNFLLGMYCSSSIVAIYSIAAQINQLFVTFATAISSVYLPKITHMIENKISDSELTKVWTNTGRVQLIIIGLIYSGFILFGREFIILWVGDQYIEGYIITIILMTPMLVTLSQNTGTMIIQVKNKNKFVSIMLLIMSFLNIVVSIILIQKFSAIGAALGTGLTMLLGSIIIKNIYYHNKVGLNVIYFIKNTICIYIIFIITGITYYKFFLVNISISGYGTLLLNVILYTFWYSFGIIFILNKEEKKYIKNFLKRRKIEHE